MSTSERIMYIIKYIQHDYVDQIIDTYEQRLFNLQNNNRYWASGA
jgi:hypothetical protein